MELPAVSFYAESPFERIVDVHWKKKKPDDGGGGGGGDEPQKYPCYTSFDTSDPFGQGKQYWNGRFEYFYIEPGLTWLNWFTNPTMESFYDFSQYPPQLWPSNVADTSCGGTPDYQYPPVPALWAWHDGNGPTADFPQGLMLNGGIGSTVTLSMYGDDLIRPRWVVWENTCLSDLYFYWHPEYVPPTYVVEDFELTLQVQGYSEDPHPVPTPPFPPDTHFFCSTVVGYSVDAGAEQRTFGIRVDHSCDGPDSLGEGTCPPSPFARSASEIARSVMARPRVRKYPQRLLKRSAPNSTFLRRPDLR
jgi:hypothetical protein